MITAKMVSAKFLVGNKKILDEVRRVLANTKAVVLVVKNCTRKKLVNPQVLVSSGKIATVIPYVIKPQTSAVIEIRKSFGIKGAVATVTYDVLEEKRICVHCCNPIIGHNNFNLKWISISKELNEDLVQQLDDPNHKCYARGQMKWYEACDVSYKTIGFMTQSEPAFLQVNVFERK